MEIDSQIQSLQTKNPNSYENLIKTLELSKSLYPQYVRAIPEKKAKMLKLVASNYTLSDASICPKYRKPFDIIAKGLSRPNWLPFVDSYRTFIVTLSTDILEGTKSFGRVKDSCNNESSSFYLRYMNEKKELEPMVQAKYQIFEKNFKFVKRNA